MAVVSIRPGRPTLSEVAIALSDPRVGIGAVTRADVLKAVNGHSLIDVRESRIDSRWVSTVYFTLARSRGILS